MKCLKYVISFILLFSLFGCNSNFTTITERKEIPYDRIYNYDVKTKEKNATITVTRDDSYIGYFCYLALYINNDLAGRFSPKETKQFYIEPGEILLKVTKDPYGKGLCSPIFRSISSQIEIFIDSNKRKSYRIKMGDLGIQRSDY